MKISSFALLTSLLLGFSGCLTLAGMGGTDVGNPGPKTSENVAASFAQISCETLNFCYSGFNRQQCERASMSLNGVAPLMGAPTPKLTLQEVDVGLADGTVSLTPDQRGLCSSHLRRLRCTDLPLNNIWKTTSPEDFRGILVFWSHVSGTCGQVFK